MGDCKKYDSMGVSEWGREARNSEMSPISTMPSSTTSTDCGVIVEHGVKTLSKALRG